MKYAVLSIKPQDAQLILEGKKTVEIRRQQMWIDPGTTLFLYATASKKAVVGSVSVLYVLSEDTWWIWRHCRDMICMDLLELFSYAGKRRKVSAIFLENPTPFAEPITMAQIREIRSGWFPPRPHEYIALDEALKPMFLKRMPANLQF